jgi:putative tricarboxylic transport membrane protein
MRAGRPPAPATRAGSTSARPAPAAATASAVRAAASAAFAYAVFALAGVPLPARAGALDGAECIAPSRPGGGFEISCDLAQAALGQAGLLAQPLRVEFLPGGIGAAAFQQMLTQRAADGHAIVAFSSGSLLNLVQGRFGPHDEHSVRWLAVLGLDHGVVAVRAESPWHSLPELLAALKARPEGVVFGAAGAIGSQDWMKVALLARTAGVSHKAMRFVAFEGGGDALSALEGGHVDVLAADAAEVARQLAAGARVRVLAVLAPRRIQGPLHGVPTAREQGVPVDWPIARGFYLGPHVPEAEVAEWRAALARAAAAPGFPRLRVEAGLEPLTLSGPELDAWIAQSMARYRALATEFGLVHHP